MTIFNDWNTDNCITVATLKQYENDEATESIQMQAITEGGTGSAWRSTLYVPDGNMVRLEMITMNGSLF